MRRAPLGLRQLPPPQARAAQGPQPEDGRQGGRAAEEGRPDALRPAVEHDRGGGVEFLAVVAGLPDQVAVQGQRVRAGKAALARLESPAPLSFPVAAAALARLGLVLKSADDYDFILVDAHHLQHYLVAMSNEGSMPTLDIPRWIRKHAPATLLDGAGKLGKCEDRHFKLAGKRLERA